MTEIVYYSFLLIKAIIQFCNYQAFYRLRDEIMAPVCCDDVTQNILMAQSSYHFRSLSPLNSHTAPVNTTQLCLNYQ